MLEENLLSEEGVGAEDGAVLVERDGVISRELGRSLSDETSATSSFSRRLS